MRALASIPAVILALVASLANPSDARADFVTYSASNAAGLSASVTFADVGGTLVVVLTNTSLADVMNPNQVLSGLWFNAPGELTPFLALVNVGSGVVNDWNIPFVGGEWAYRGDLAMNFGADSGISAVGLGIFGAGDRFAGPDLDPPLSPAGINYGITSAGDNPNTGSGGVASTPLIKNSVVFILSGWCADWSVSDITDVFFQYGSSLDGPRLTAVPEPGILALLGVALVGMAGAARKFSGR